MKRTIPFAKVSANVWHSIPVKSDNYGKSEKKKKKEITHFTKFISSFGILSDLALERCETIILNYAERSFSVTINDSEMLFRLMTNICRICHQDTGYGYVMHVMISLEYFVFSRCLLYCSASLSKKCKTLVLMFIHGEKIQEMHEIFVLKTATIYKILKKSKTSNESFKQ